MIAVIFEPESGSPHRRLTSLAICVAFELDVLTTEPHPAVLSSGA